MSISKSDRNDVYPTGTKITALDTGLLILRLALGVVFFAHGSQKVLGWFGGHGMHATAAAFVSMGIPLFLAYIAMFTEFLGGMGLIFGVLSRLSALGIFINMAVAVLKVHIHNGFFMNWGMVPGKGEGYEYHILVMAICLMILFVGPGRFAIMRKI
jgi:putative oxidoreductase